MDKKILLFIVEGLSDKDALEPILSEIIDNNNIHFEVLHHDLTSEFNSGTLTQNKRQILLEKITKVIKSYLIVNRGINKKDIKKVIILTDTDGCFIPSSNVYFSENDMDFRYEDNGIFSDRPDNVRERNILKSNNLNIAFSTPKVYSLPLEIYYFSCNLDHVLFNVRNLDISLKEEYAFDFSDQYENREIEFLDFIFQQDICLSQSYEEAWKKIEENNNSLLRFSNFNTFFIKNLDILNTETKEKTLNLLSKYNKEQ